MSDGAELQYRIDYALKNNLVDAFENGLVITKTGKATVQERGGYKTVTIITPKDLSIEYDKQSGIPIRPNVNGKRKIDSRYWIQDTAYCHWVVYIKFKGFFDPAEELHHVNDRKHDNRLINLRPEKKDEHSSITQHSKKIDITFTPIQIELLKKFTVSFPEIKLRQLASALDCSYRQLKEIVAK